MMQYFEFFGKMHQVGLVFLHRLKVSDLTVICHSISLLVGVALKDIAISAGSLVRFPGRLKRTQCRQWLAKTSMFLQSCVALALDPAIRYTLWRNTARMIKFFSL